MCKSLVINGQILVIRAAEPSQEPQTERKFLIGIWFYQWYILQTSSPNQFNVNKALNLMWILTLEEYA
jgi:hypothetical protein